MLGDIKPWRPPFLKGFGAGDVAGGESLPLRHFKAASRNPRKIRLSCTPGFAGVAPRCSPEGGPICHGGPDMTMLWTECSSALRYGQGDQPPVIYNPFSKSRGLPPLSSRRANEDRFRTDDPTRGARCRHVEHARRRRAGSYESIPERYPFMASS